MITFYLYIVNGARDSFNSAFWDMQKSGITFVKDKRMV